jgi:bifunctional ADP-heptose synthase (sugar kinase/adenylyltransferase)
VELLSMLGAADSEESWIRERLSPQVGAHFHHKSNSPTIVKRRYMESYFGTPLFAINFLNDTPLTQGDESALLSALDERMGGVDLVVVADYGHQMLGQAAVEMLASRAPFLAVNTQANAANLGFHTISKYPRADFIVLAEHELQLECRSRSPDLRGQLAEVAARLSAGALSVTLGKRGCLCFRPETGYHQAASLATVVVDRLGAGDAFFAISSLGAAVRAPLEILAFLGNVAGAEAVAYVGNSRSIDDGQLRRHITSLFK